MYRFFMPEKGSFRPSFWSPENWKCRFWKYGRWQNIDFNTKINIWPSGS